MTPTKPESSPLLIEISNRSELDRFAEGFKYKALEEPEYVKEGARWLLSKLEEWREGRFDDETGNMRCWTGDMLSHARKLCGKEG